MIITKKVRRRLAHKDDFVEYSITYLSDNPQKYINKYIKVESPRNELNCNDNSKNIDFNAHNEMNNYPPMVTKEELISSINAMLEQDRKRIIEEKNENCLTLKKKYHRF